MPGVRSDSQLAMSMIHAKNCKGDTRMKFKRIILHEQLIIYFNSLLYRRFVPCVQFIFAMLLEPCRRFSSAILVYARLHISLRSYLFYPIHLKIYENHDYWHRLCRPGFRRLFRRRRQHRAVPGCRRRQDRHAQRRRHSDPRAWPGRAGRAQRRRRPPAVFHQLRRSRRPRGRACSWRWARRRTKTAAPT